MKTIKEKWIEALRSGNYTQSSRYLKANYCHCCLGVLGEIQGKVSSTSRNDFRSIIIDLDIKDDDQYVLAFLNDIKHYSFNDIADYIEEYASDDLKVWNHPLDLIDGFRQSIEAV